MGLLWELFTTFFKIGIFAYGGGPAMIPVMQVDVVDGNEWVTDEDFGTAVAIGYSLPGPIAPKMAFWAGLQTAGIWGGLIAMFAVVLPSILLMGVATQLLWNNIDSNAYLAGAAKGASIGVIGLLAYVTYNQAFKTFGVKSTGWPEALTSHVDWLVLVIVIFALVLWRPGLMIPLSIAISALYGAFFLR